MIIHALQNLRPFASLSVSFQYLKFEIRNILMLVGLALVCRKAKAYIYSSVLSLGGPSRPDMHSTRRALQAT